MLLEPIPDCQLPAQFLPRNLRAGIYLVLKFGGFPVGSFQTQVGSRQAASANFPTLISSSCARACASS